ncbi:MAG: hypothetical protein AAF891_05570 [Pseudomonadota bacterium]
MATAVLLSLAVYLTGAGLFAAAQAIWVDESTQMSGLALPLDTQLAWLLRRSDVALGVPPDRMPPFSYWFGTVWSWGFGLTEMSMRWFGIVAVLLSAPAIYMTGRLAGGLAGAVFAIAFVFASPSIMVHAVEIRTYPLFFCFSAWAVWSYMRLLHAPAAGYVWTLLILFLTGASYAHFYGLPLAGCLLFSLFVQRLWTRRALWPVALAVLSYGVLWTGVIPFFLASLGSGRGEAEVVALALSELLYGLGRLGFRHLFHPVLLASPVMLGLGLLGAMALAVLSLIRLRPDGPAAPGTPVAFVLLPLGLGFAGLAGLKVLLFLVGKNDLDPLVPHYNLWQLPLLVAFLACALRAGAGRFMAMGCATAVIAAKLWGVALLLQNPATYTHGAAEWLADAIEDPPQTLVIHEANGAWGSIFFPVNYLTGQQTTQWLRQSDGRVAQFGPRGMIPIADPVTAQQDFARVIEVHARNFVSRDLARITRGEATCDFRTPLTEAPGSTLDTYCAYVSAVRRITDNAP